MSPPTRSTAREMPLAERVAVPLNSRCSRKWLTPAWWAASSREPISTHAPIATDRAPGTWSVATVRPLGSWVTESVMTVVRRAHDGDGATT